MDAVDDGNGEEMQKKNCKLNYTQRVHSSLNESTKELLYMKIINENKINLCFISAQCSMVLMLQQQHFAIAQSMNSRLDYLG
jgi:hypothetical protein